MALCSGDVFLSLVRLQAGYLRLIVAGPAQQALNAPDEFAIIEFYGDYLAKSSGGLVLVLCFCGESLTHLQVFWFTFDNDIVALVQVLIEQL